MNRKKSTLIGSIIAAGIVAAVINFGIVDSTSVNNLDINCLTAEQGKQITTFTKMPTDFPRGYSIQCIAVDNPNEIDMLISDRPVTSNEWQRESVHPSGSNIFLHQIDESKYLTESDYEHLGTAEQRIRTTIAEINAYNPKLNATYFVIDGMPAYGTEACADCGIQTANFGDDSVIKQTYDVTSKLKIISDDGIRYSFYGNVPLDDLVKIGNSLQ